MNYEILGSSSKGNCIIVDDVLMLDCGVSYSKIKSYLKEIKIIFISHHHKDHFLLSTIKNISYNYPNIVFLTGSKEVVYKLSKYIAIENIWLLTPSTWWHLGLLKIKLDPLTHDVENYALHFEYRRRRGIYIVDTANVDDIIAKDYDLYLIENNYQEKVSDNIKNTIWIPEYYYKQLKTNNRNTIIFENEKYWKEFDGSAFKDGAVWTDVFECQSLLLSDYCFYISGNKWKYGISFFALIEEQTPEQIIYSVHKSYVNSCLYDKRYDSDYCFNKDLVYLLDRNKPFKIIFDIDGDYLKMYLQQDNKKEFIQTYVKTSAKALYQIEEWIKNKSNDLSEVSWPRHTEKSSEIDVIKGISAVQTNSATNIEKNKLFRFSIVIREALGALLIVAIV